MNKLSIALALAFLAGPALGQPVQAPAFFGAVSVNASATGTTAATAATIPGVSGKTAYLCGLSIRANATAAVTGDATVVGLKSGTMTFKQFTAPVASGIGVLEPPIGPACLPASGPAVDIVVTSAAPGTAGLVSVNAWGFYQ